MNKEEPLEGRTIWINGQPFDGFNTLKIHSQPASSEKDIPRQVAHLSGLERLPRNLDLSHCTLHLDFRPTEPVLGHPIARDEFTQLVDPKSSQAVIKKSASPKDAPCPESVQSPTNLEIKTLPDHKPTGISFFDLQHPQLEAIMFRHLTSAVFIPIEELNAIVLNKTKKTLTLWWNDVKQNIFSVYPEDSVQVIPLFK